MNDLFNRLRQKDDFFCRSSTSTGEIAALEKSLGVRLPEAYRKFLYEFGSAEWFGHAVFGISDDSELDTLAQTRALKDEYLLDDFKRVPDEGCALERYGGGGYYFLFSQDSERSGQVALFLDELYGGEAESWPSFTEFLKYMVEL